MANKEDYVDLGESCARVCQALDRGLDGRKMDELSRSVLGAIEQLIMRVNPTMIGRATDSPELPSQDCIRDPEKDRQAKRTKRNLSGLPLWKRQGRHRSLGARSR